jgi:hypothetical protein
MTQEDPDSARAALLAMQIRFRIASTLMRAVELEMAGLSANARRERMQEFDARVAALLKEQDDIAAALRASLNPSGLSGNA